MERFQPVDVLEVRNDRIEIRGRGTRIYYMNVYEKNEQVIKSLKIFVERSSW